MMRMTRLTLILHSAGVVLGGFFGWLYYAKVGCLTGHCMIWGNPWMAIFYGALLGFLVAGLIPVAKKKASTDPPSE